ncbi:hypothetical protein AAMO2058_000669200 [Amorphochlora amoebiformis]
MWCCNSSRPARSSGGQCTSFACSQERVPKMVFRHARLSDFQKMCILEKNSYPRGRR